MTSQSTASFRNLFFLPATSLWWRDVLRFVRQRNRIVSAFATPLVFWLLLGAGFSESFRPSGAADSESYLVYFFPGTVVLIMLFTAIFSTISVIEDRKEGILQGWLVTPATPSSLVFGKFMAGTTLSLLQGILFTFLAPLVGIPIGWQNVIPLLLAFSLTGFAMTGLGFLFAWPLDSTAGFHALMNIFLMPLWMMSGALFPVSASAGWVWWVYVLNPVSYCVEAVRLAMRPEPWAVVGEFPGPVWSFLISFLFCVVLFVISCRIAARPRTK